MPLKSPLLTTDIFWVYYRHFLTDKWGVTIVWPSFYLKQMFESNFPVILVFAHLKTPHFFNTLKSQLFSVIKFKMCKYFQK